MSIYKNEKIKKIKGEMLVVEYPISKNEALACFYDAEKFQFRVYGINDSLGCIKIISNNEMQYVDTDLPSKESCLAISNFLALNGYDKKYTVTSTCNSNNIEIFDNIKSYFENLWKNPSEDKFIDQKINYTDLRTAVLYSDFKGKIVKPKYISIEMEPMLEMQTMVKNEASFFVYDDPYIPKKKESPIRKLVKKYLDK